LIVRVENISKKIPMAVKNNPLNSPPRIMGILNVTPDSFSDGGVFYDTDRAVAQGLAMIAAGADIIDVGGESTRPGSAGVSAETEMSRVVPVIRALAQQTDTLISVDTVKPEVAEAAIASGAGMVNDVSNLRDGDILARLAAKTGVILVLMHSRGTPKTMKTLADYQNVVEEVKSELVESIARARDAGMPKERIWIDPGIGFAKRAKESLTLLARLDALVALGHPVLVGPSRKSFIGEVVSSDVRSRLGGTAAAVTTAVMKGAHAVRVHDVEEMHQAAMVAHAIRTAGFFGHDEVAIV
jgi:dihydropteroate synthase